MDCTAITWGQENSFRPQRSTFSFEDPDKLVNTRLELARKTGERDGERLSGHRDVMS